MKIDTFVKKAMGKVDSAAFIAENRDFLCGFRSVLPVLALLERKQIYPTPALQQIVQLLVLEKPEPETETVRTEVVDPTTGQVTVQSVPAKSEGRKRAQKKYQLFMFVKDGSGLRVNDEVFDAEEFGDAQRMAHRKLFHREDASHMDIIGMGITTTITRNEAVSAILRHGPGGRAAMKRMSKSTGTLGWKVSAKGFVAKFSRG